MEAWESVEKQLVDVRDHTWTSFLQMYGGLRALFYIAEVMPLTILSHSLRSKLRNLNKDDWRHLRQIIDEVWLLIQQDSERITAGLYPAAVLNPTLNMGHWGQLLHIWMDGVRSTSRSRNFVSEIEDLEALRDIPGHYRPNSNGGGNNGFLDPSATSLYEHQMELLFLGSMDAMRRLLLAPMKKAFRFSEGEGLRFLEIGCGAGRMTQFVKMAFPRAKITVLDANPIYLKEAQKNLREYNRIDFIQGDALDLPFRDKRFDVVYSSFLLHEVSLDIRRQILAEAFRVLGGRGFLGVVDLIQVDDCRELNWTLEQPWFVGQEGNLKDYGRNSLAGSLQRLGLSQVGTERGFLGKAVFGIRD
jgi:ubiquinone/menaquinone biosynthesis C-methylase UbiE